MNILLMCINESVKNYITDTVHCEIIEPEFVISTRVQDKLNDPDTFLFTNVEGVLLLSKSIEILLQWCPLFLNKLFLLGPITSLQEWVKIPGKCMDSLLFIPLFPQSRELIVGGAVTPDKKKVVSDLFPYEKIHYTNIETALHFGSMVQLMLASQSSVWSVIESLNLDTPLDKELLLRMNDIHSQFPDTKSCSFSNDERYVYIRSLIEYLRTKSLPTHFPEGVLRNMTFFWRLQNRMDYLMDSDSIEFYNIDEPFGFLSNFSEHPIYMNGCIWPTVEHYYQGQKFREKSLQEAIRLAPSPATAKDITLSMKKYHRGDWQEIKVAIMRQALRAKFSQHPDLYEDLLLTSGKQLMEHTENDAFWGDGKKGSGKNMLGQLLMEIRDSYLKIADCVES